MSDSPIFKTEALTVITHEDPAKHYIGESLTPPSASDVSVSGTETTTGDSPFPARSDHTHDNRNAYTTVAYSTTGGMVCAGGTTTYINDLSYHEGKDYFSPGSTQLILVPQEGTYLSSIRVSVLRSTGTTFPAATTFVFTIAYNNATILRTLAQGTLPARPDLIFTSTDFATLASDGNVQISYYNADTVNHNVYIYYWTLMRLCSGTGG